MTTQRGHIRNYKKLLKSVEQAKLKGKGAKTSRVKSKFKGWEKIKIKAKDDVEKEAIAPVIISASRVTDIPKFYSDWFMERLKQGYLVRRMPRKTDTEYISFSKTRMIVFWTKNPEPIFRHLNEIPESVARILIYK